MPRGVVFSWGSKLAVSDPSSPGWSPAPPASKYVSVPSKRTTRALGKSTTSGRRVPVALGTRAVIYAVIQIELVAGFVNHSEGAQLVMSPDVGPPPASPVNGSPPLRARGAMSPTGLTETHYRDETGGCFRTPSPAGGGGGVPRLSQSARRIST